MIGASEGLTLQYVGGEGRFFGSDPVAALICAWTSLGGGVDVTVEIELDGDLRRAQHADRGHLRDAGDLANCRSSGCATAVAMVSGLAPGYFTFTLMVGKSTCGRGATGSSGNAASPTSNSAAMNNEVATGRWMKGVEMLMCRCVLFLEGSTGS